MLPKEIRRIADFESEVRRDPRLKSEHTQRGYRRDLTVFEEWRKGRMLSKLLVEQYAAEMQELGDNIEKKLPGWQFVL